MNLENWSRVHEMRPVDIDFKGPIVFRGRMYGHALIPDGQWTHVTVQGFSFRDDAFIDEEGNLYRLKDIDPTYESLYSKVQARLTKLINSCYFLIPSYRRMAA